MTELRKQIETAINCTSSENVSNTPDFILAEYLTDCLAAFDKATNRREDWHSEDGNPRLSLSDNAKRTGMDAVGRTQSTKETQNEQ